MDSWSSDLVLSVLSFLPLKDLNRLSQVSSRFYYLIYHYRQLRGPEIVAATSHTPGVSTRQATAPKVIQEALSKLQTPPNLALGFSSFNNTLASKLPALLPAHTISLNAVATSIQSSVDGQLECQSNTSLMLASLPPHRAHIRSFCLETQMTTEPIRIRGETSNSNNNNNNIDSLPFQTLIRTLQQSTSGGDDDDDDNFSIEWKVFLVYACGNGMDDAEKFVTRLQAHFPQATIVGGICHQGSVSLPVMQSLRMSMNWNSASTSTSTTSDFNTMDYDQQMLHDMLMQMRGMDLVDLQKRLGGPQIKMGRSKREMVERILKTLRTKKLCLHMVEDGIFGVALGGEVPVRAIVSRGVRSLTQQHDFDHDDQQQQQQHLLSNNFVVRDVEFHRPGDERYILRYQHPDEATPYYIIRTVYDQETGKTLTANQLLRKFGQPDFIGLQRSGEDGFELHVPDTISYNTNAFVLPYSGAAGGERSMQNASFDLFDLDGGLCLKDMEAKMKSLQLATAGEKVLGAIMYSCSARGPMPGDLISESMADANRFAQAFPDVPLLGFYAGGEIGPLALAGQRQSVFQAGNATLQGFTAVFAVFIVPVVDLGAIQLDDRVENIQAFIRERLG